MIYCRQQRRFLVIDEAQFILVEPDTTKLGWGVVKFVARLQVTNFSRHVICTVHSLFTTSDNCFVSKLGFNAQIEYTVLHSTLIRFGNLLNVNTYSTLRKGKFSTVQLDIRCTPSLVYLEMLTDLIASGVILTVNVLCKTFF